MTDGGNVNARSIVPNYASIFERFLEDVDFIQ